MSSLTKNHSNNNFDLSCKAYKQNTIALKCGNTNSLVILPDTEAGTAYTVSSINVNNANSIILEFDCNITTASFVGTISFQVLKLCNNKLTAIPIGPSWIFSRLSANTGSDIFSFFICDCDVCLDECCNYFVVATILDGITTVTIPNVGDGGTITLSGGGTVILNGNVTITFGNTLTFNGVVGDVTITGALGAVSQSDGTVTVNNVEPGSTITNISGIGIIDTVSGIPTVIVTPVNGSVIERTSTNGTCTINNAALAAIYI